MVAVQPEVTIILAAEILGGGGGSRTPGPASISQQFELDASDIGARGQASLDRSNSDGIEPEILLHQSDVHSRYYS